MRNRRQRIGAMLAIGILVSTIPLATPAKAGISFSVSYWNLSPHGSWLVSADYGRVWRPNVASADWHPYYDGHWVYADVGWTWVSDYPWGAIPYHYGTWAVDADYGWIWVPGEVWAPSWVVFCSGPDYIGWAPVPPRYSVGVSLGFGDIGPERFVVVPARDVFTHSVRAVALPASRSRGIAGRTRIVNRITVKNSVVINQGPDIGHVERASGRRVRAVPIESVHRAAPGPRVAREELRVNRSRSGRSPRAVEPVSERTPLPGPKEKPGSQGKKESKRKEKKPGKPGGGHD